MLTSLLSFLFFPALILAIENLVVFGDSYSDVGNFQRWTNGPVWSEHVAAAWNASLHSFAYSGSVCDNALYPNTTSIYYNTPSIMDQVEYFYRQELDFDPSDTVYAFWVGINDVHLLYKETPVSPPLDAISACLAYQIETLHRLLNADKILLINLPPMEKMPFFQKSTMAEERQEAVVELNRQLREHAQTLNDNYPRLKLDIIDAHQLLDDIASDPGSFGFSNTDTAYWDDCETHCDAKSIDTYVWWDRTHFTGGIHYFLANVILRAGSFAPSMSAQKAKTHRLLLTTESIIRSPIYRALPHSHLLADMWDNLDEQEIILIPYTHAMDRDLELRHWMLFVVVVTVAMVITLAVWQYSKRKHTRANYRSVSEKIEA
ncbi:hypothetical protein DM01DRAFT_1317426 [Hesseltinella vesiculosa]|uniref:SGNH hydrolase n=1 Tax=Hesseltinella vesiculosa TaxID=101127 RepID=A0A1X2GQQ7_9FUNG|nr:hypothetical protein DM01DRAFT_1317426 [Hesseltinella vesiculosa]